MAKLLLLLFSAHRSLQSPVPNGSWARLKSFQNANLPNNVLLLLIVWSTRATYSSMLPPVLVALTKLSAAEVLFGRGRYLSRNTAVGVRRFVGIILPVNGVRGQATVGSVQAVGSTDSGS